MTIWFNLLNQLPDEQREWLFQTGVEEKLPAQAILIEKDAPVDGIYFVIKGLLNVFTHSNQQSIKVLGPGEIIGEISFLDEGKSTATIKAAEETVLLKLEKNILQAKLSQDKAFAEYFYKSLSNIIARRLRATLADLDFTKHSKEVKEELAHIPELKIFYNLWQNFKNSIAQLSNADLQEKKISTELIQEAQNQFQKLVLSLNDLNAVNAKFSDDIKKKLGKQLQAEILPYILLTTCSLRSYTKPRGYAGDYEMIDLIYQNKGSGTGTIGPIIDQFMLDLPVCRAVRNRRQLLCNEIKKLFDKKDSVHIASFASGPAAEVFDVFEDLNDKSSLTVTLLDFDILALASVAQKRDQKGLQKNIDLINENLIYLALGKKKIYLKPYDLIYSIGLIDYFQDELVIKLINYIYDALKPGGKVILGNFHTDNPQRLFMEGVLNWYLIHRNEEDMNRLFKLSKFNKPCDKIQFEPERINLFAECTRE